MAPNGYYTAVCYPCTVKGKHECDLVRKYPEPCTSCARQNALRPTGMAKITCDRTRMTMEEYQRTLTADKQKSALAQQASAQMATYPVNHVQAQGPNSFVLPYNPAQAHMLNPMAGMFNINPVAGIFNFNPMAPVPYPMYSFLAGGGILQMPLMPPTKSRSAKKHHNRNRRVKETKQMEEAMFSRRAETRESSEGSEEESRKRKTAEREREKIREELAQITDTRDMLNSRSMELVEELRKKKEGHERERGWREGNASRLVDPRSHLPHFKTERDGNAAPNAPIGQGSIVRPVQEGPLMLAGPWPSAGGAPENRPSASATGLGSSNNMIERPNAEIFPNLPGLGIVVHQPNHQNFPTVPVLENRVAITNKPNCEGFPIEIRPGGGAGAVERPNCEDFAEENHGLPNPT
ncbi:uncharacterized protein LTR77_004368 [Saxophila tyrrhenica]|uniref:Uncharacterized protein n=1 Tax=Saxophila tyrrhenica TaxID=1690608 RepID=A0AAV9PCS2_9PEZI|nr:hypothetical protein LTR77_004368 [Saxophila tyrrhenica]